MKLDFNFGAMTFVHILIYLDAHKDQTSEFLAIEMQIIADGYISDNLWEEINKIKFPKRTADVMQLFRLEKL